MRRNTAGFMLTVALSLIIMTFSPAFAENSITVDRAGNSIIQTGQSINITVTTEQPATGTLTVFSPDKTTSWSIPISQPAGQHKYVFPDDFPTGANTTVFGPYNVSATMQMTVDTRVWNAEFKVEFFAVPDLPFGAIMATVASFAAFGLMKTKHKKPISRSK